MILSLQLNKDWLMNSNPTKKMKYSFSQTKNSSPDKLHNSKTKYENQFIRLPLMKLMLANGLSDRIKKEEAIFRD